MSVGVEARLLREQRVHPVGDGHPLLDRLGLALLVEGHDHHGRAVAAGEAGLAQELGLALLERQGVDDGPALDALEARLDDRPLRGVDHDRHPADVRLRRDEVEEARHGRLGVEQRLVHVDVDDLGAVVDLLARDLDGLLVPAVGDELREAARTGHVGALADVHEQRLGRDGQRLQARQAGVPRERRHDARGATRGGGRDGPDVRRASCRSSRPRS